MTEMGSLEFASRSPAKSIRQRVRYSMGDAPTEEFAREIIGGNDELALDKVIHKLSSD